MAGTYIRYPGVNSGSATAKSASFSVVAGDNLRTILMTTGASDQTVTLPAAGTSPGRILTLKKADSGVGKAILSAASIDGAVSFTLVDQDDWVEVQDATTLYIITGKGIGVRVVSRVRHEAGVGHGSTNTKIRRIETAVVNTGNAVTVALSATLGNSYTINQSAFFAISYVDRNTAAGCQVGISRNSAQLTTNVDSITAATRLAYSQTNTAQCDAVAVTNIYLTAGDVIRPHTDGGPNVGATDCNFEIAKVGI